jgi:hypothetical protein
VTYPGLGGQQAPPQNAAPAGQLVPGVQPGVTGQIVATRVVIIGSGGELFVYSPTRAAGNLIASIAGAAGTDPLGNHFLAGVASYASAFAGVLQSGSVQFYTGSLAGGWSVGPVIQTDNLGDLILSTSGTTTIVSGTTTLNSVATVATPVTNNQLQTIGSAPATYTQSYENALASRLNGVINVILQSGVGQF